MSWSRRLGGSLLEELDHVCGTPLRGRRSIRNGSGSGVSGDKGYPALIEPKRQQDIIDSLKRMDPAAMKRRQGGRRDVADPAYFLRGLVLLDHIDASSVQRSAGWRDGGTSTARHSQRSRTP